MIRQISTSDASKSGIFLVREELCDYFERQNNYCSVGQAKCSHSGISEDCQMISYYERKLEGIKRKTFEERYGQNWRKE